MNPFLEPKRSSETSSCTNHLHILILADAPDIYALTKIGASLQDCHHHSVRIAAAPQFEEVAQGAGLEFYAIEPSQINLEAQTPRGHMRTASGSGSIHTVIAEGRPDMLRGLLQGCWSAASAQWLPPQPRDNKVAPSVRVTVKSPRLKNISVPVKSKSLPASTMIMPDAIIASPTCLAHVHIAEKLKIPVHIMGSLPWKPTAAFRHPCSTKPVPKPDLSETEQDMTSSVFTNAKVLKEGYLEKKRKSVSRLLGFRKQYFWILDRLEVDGKKQRYWLAYDDDRKSDSPEQVVSLSGLKIRKASGKNSFRLTTLKRTYILRASSESECEGWMSQFQTLQPMALSSLLPSKSTFSTSNFSHVKSSGSNIRVPKGLSSDPNEDLSEDSSITLSAPTNRKRLILRRRMTQRIATEMITRMRGEPNERRDTRSNMGSRKSSRRASLQSQNEEIFGISTSQTSDLSVLGTLKIKNVPFTERDDVKVILKGYLMKKRKGMLKFQYHTQYFWLLQREVKVGTKSPASVPSPLIEQSPSTSPAAPRMFRGATVSGEPLTTKAFSWEGNTEEKNNDDIVLENFLAYDDSKKTSKPNHVVPLGRGTMVVAPQDDKDTFILMTSKRKYALRIPPRYGNKEMRLHLRNAWVQAIENITKPKEQNNTMNCVIATQRSQSVARPKPSSATSNPKSSPTTPDSKRRKKGRTRSGLPDRLLKEMSEEKEKKKANSGEKEPKKATMSLMSLRGKSSFRSMALRKDLKNKYFEQFLVVKQGYLDRKTRHLFGTNNYKRHYVWIYRTNEEAKGKRDEHFMGIDLAPSLNKPKIVVDLRNTRLEHNFIKRYIRISTSKDEFKFRAATEKAEMEWVQVFNQATKAYGRDRSRTNSPGFSIDSPLGSFKSKSKSPLASVQTMKNLRIDEPSPRAHRDSVFEEKSEQEEIDLPSPLAAANMRSHETYNKALAFRFQKCINKFRSSLGLQKILKEDSMASAINGSGVPSCGLWDGGIIPESSTWGSEFQSVGFCNVVSGHNGREVQDVRKVRDEVRDWFALSDAPVVVLAAEADQMGSIEFGKAAEFIVEASLESKIRLLTFASSNGKEDFKTFNRISMSVPVILATTSKNVLGTQTEQKEKRGRRFLHDIFETEKGRALLMQFLIKEMSAENLVFLEAVGKWEEDYSTSKKLITSTTSEKEKKNIAKKVQQDMKEIYGRFIASDAPKQVNLAEAVRKRVIAKIEKYEKNFDGKSISIPRDIFEEAANGIMHLMQRDSVLRFRRTEEYLELMRELHGSDEDFYVRELDPTKVDMRWLLTRPRVKAAITFGDSPMIWRILSVGIPCLILTRNPVDSFWARALMPTKAVVAVPTRGSRKGTYLWALKEIMQRDTITHARDVSQALTLSRLDEACATAIRHFHESINLLPTMRCQLLPSTLRRFWIKNIGLYIGEEALSVLVSDRSPPFNDSKSLEIHTCVPNWRNPSQWGQNKEFLKKIPTSRLMVLRSRLTSDEVTLIRERMKEFQNGQKK
mmetsp:Transcript_9237/g.13869  ORF Transcript_9237/g.13869 Transcript_9237/m.13869 type:complete len:1504 (-) Transcript_9237:139-4650(-)